MLKSVGKLVIIIVFVTVNIASADNKIDINSLVKEYELKKNMLQGGAIALLHKGHVVYKNTFGKQKDNNGNITSQTLFPLASVSKSVTTMAIALMVENGVLHFKDSFKLPYLRYAVTLENFLSNTTGYKFKGNGYIEQGIRRDGLLKMLKRYNPQCLPGKCYQYSNTMFSLVVEALETKDISFNSLIYMFRTKLHTDGIQIMPIDSLVNIAYPHAKKTINGKLYFASLTFPQYYPKTVPASAGVFASLDGMIEFAKLSFGYRSDLISKKTLDSIFMPISLNEDIYKWNIKLPCNKNNIKSYYAMGWRVLKIKGHSSKTLIFHSGYISGTRAFIGFIPSKEVAIIILGNQDARFPAEYGLSIWEKLVNLHKVCGK
ncbi:MAG: beta-lactamase family protein [Rickettsiales bacterium]|nr:beta-lactamase family protein [Rickettsiales bacterium]